MKFWDNFRKNHREREDNQGRLLGYPFFEDKSEMPDRKLMARECESGAPTDNSVIDN